MSATFATTQQQQLQPLSLSSVLAAPLAGRGDLLARLLAEASLKELAAVLPVLLEDIFGFGGRPGWNLQLVTRKCHPAEFDGVRALLRPAGPLFAVIYRLCAEPHVTYEFPASCLPGSAAGGGVSAGHWTLLSPQSAGGGGGPAWGGSLMLSPFELYLHHFCYFLLNPAQQAAPIAWTQPGDALYPTLLEDLMTHLLPCGGAWVPPLTHPAAHHHLHQLHHPATSTISPEPRPPASPPRLLLRSALLRPASPGRPGSPPASPGHMAGIDTWRSEALLRITAAFWLETPGRAADPRPASPAQNDSLSKSLLYDLDPRVPSHDHVRVVRMLVKHMHFFVNSPHQLPGLDEFKRQAQAMLQKKLYGFLRHAIQHWPTDTSFRLILETWLSYIQPWRYTDYANSGRSPTTGAARESERQVDDSWARFVAENLLFYAAIFRQLLPRLQRMELTVPKYAYMVFRLAKVMGQPGLWELVRSAEELRAGGRWSAGGRAAPPAGQSSLLYAASIGQHIIDLEEPGFAYQSMMDASCTQQVHGLVRRLAESRAALQAHLASLPDAGSGSGAFWTSLMTALGARSPEPSGAELSAEESRRTIGHLESGAAQLARLYNLQVPEPAAAAAPDSPATPPGQRLPGWPAATPLAGGLLTPSGLKSPAARPSAPETELTPQGPRLTARGRHQLLSGLCRGDVTFQGDPERRPVQSCESGALLRLLQAAGRHVNTAYGPEMAALYQRADLAGYAARCVLLPPATFYELARGADGRSERRAVPRPAQLSLRPLADQRRLAALGAAVLAALAAGLSPGAALGLVLLLLPALAVLVAAVLRMGRDRWRGEPPQGLTDLMDRTE